MTVVRGQDNTTARAYSTNDRFELRPTAALFNEKANANEYLPLTGGTLSGSLKAQVFGNAEVSAQYGTGLEAKLGAYAAETTLYLPSPSVDFRLRARAGTADTLAVMAKYSGTERDGLLVDYLGRVTTPYQPAFYAYLISNPTSNGYTNYQNVTVSSSGLGANGLSDLILRHTWVNRGSHYNTTTGVFTAPIAGVYEFLASGLGDTSTGSGSARFMEILVNGQKYNGTESYLEPTNTMHNSRLVVSLSANDSVKVRFDGGLHHRYTSFQGNLVG
jgi:hypothetical protein